MNRTRRQHWQHWQHWQQGGFRIGRTGSAVLAGLVTGAAFAACAVPAAECAAPAAQTVKQASVSSTRVRVRVLAPEPYRWGDVAFGGVEYATGYV